METGLKGRVAIVAGSSSGIGKAAALAFAAEGAHIALCARRQDKLEAVAAEARERHGVETFTASLDAADDAAIRRFAEDVHRRWGRIDICVPNAGGPPSKPFAETTMDEWESAWRLNLRSVVSFAQAVLPRMQERRWGRIVTITSVSVKQPVPNLVLSNAVRAGVSGLIRTLANEYGPDGITVNNVGPGFTATDRLKSLAAQRGGDDVGSQAYLANLGKDVPLRRVAAPEEVADAIVWLASERASYITGQTILVDGGAYRGL
jgi:3-oxoacyl-[acyl-carrier protein] reductase